MLAQRAGMLAKIRTFMEERGIMEVETPVMDRAGNPDPNIQSLITRRHTGRLVPDTLYLHTSPEFAMKRLLASGSGPIYQICKVFRDEQPGRLHQPEFTMLEWYRPGFNHHDLMDETADLLQFLGLSGGERMSYGEAFAAYCGIDPHLGANADLQTLAEQCGLVARGNNRSQLLDFLFSHQLLPRLEQQHALFLYDFPACQAALARIRDGRPAVAERFELIINCMEIANGYNELTDYNEQDSRFIQEHKKRQELGLEALPADNKLLAALSHGLPDCAGVAVGLDRLLMCLSGARNIDEVLAFPLSELP
jgi:lysyl-tRNA synthetase class 2